MAIVFKRCVESPFVPSLEDMRSIQLKVPLDTWIEAFDSQYRPRTWNAEAKRWDLEELSNGDPNLRNISYVTYLVNHQDGDMVQAFVDMTYHSSNVHVTKEEYYSYLIKSDLRFIRKFNQVYDAAVGNV